MSDWELLQQYLVHASQRAFTRLVQRHVQMVYSVCRRQLGDPHLAEDAAQMTFAVLASKARSLRPGPLGPWLYQTARYVSTNIAREREWRRRRERAFAAAHEEATRGGIGGAEIDEMLTSLCNRDRNAVILRYMEGRSLREVATELQVSEEAARKRVIRGLGRLRQMMSVDMPAITMAAIARLLRQSKDIAPPELATNAVQAAGRRAASRGAPWKHWISGGPVRVAASLAACVILVSSSGRDTRSAVSGPAAATTTVAVAGAPATQDPAPMTVDRRLNRRMRRLDLDKKGFGDSLNYLTGVAHIEIDCDWESLQRIGIERRTPVTVHLQGGTVIEALQAILASVGTPERLVYSVNGSRILVHSAAPTLSQAP